MKNARPLAGKVAIIASLTISVFLSLSVSSNASGILYQFNAPVSNSANHGASIPALTADFQNANHGVFLTISGSGLTANEFASDI